MVTVGGLGPKVASLHPMVMGIMEEPILLRVSGFGVKGVSLSLI